MTETLSVSQIYTNSMYVFYTYCNSILITHLVYKNINKQFYTNRKYIKADVNQTATLKSYCQLNFTKRHQNVEKTNVNDYTN